MSDSPSFVQVNSVVDRLFAGDFPAETSPEVLITGQNLVRGAVLGRITASGKLNLSLSAAGDGSEVPFAILAHDTDATAADNTSTPVYLTGTFNEGALTLGAAHTVTSIKVALRDRGIFLKTAQSV